MPRAAALTLVAVFVLTIGAQEPKKNEPKKETVNYKPNDRTRPRPKVIEPGTASTADTLGKPPSDELKDGKLARFAIAGEDKKWVWANAVIVGDSVVCTHPDVPNPVAVRYAFTMNPVGANLYNRDGLPASPFRTDDW